MAKGSVALRPPGDGEPYVRCKAQRQADVNLRAQ